MKSKNAGRVKSLNFSYHGKIQVMCRQTILYSYRYNDKSIYQAKYVTVERQACAHMEDIYHSLPSPGQGLLLALHSPHLRSTVHT